MRLPKPDSPSTTEESDLPVRSSIKDTSGPANHHHPVAHRSGAPRTEPPPPQQTLLSILRHFWNYSQSAPKSTVSSQDWEVTELTHRGRNAFLRTAKKEIRGKSQELLYQEKLHLSFFLKKYSNHTEEKWVFSQARNNKKRSWVKSCFWGDDAKIWL